jgi:hypothetical protein
MESRLEEYIWKWIERNCPTNKPICPLCESTFWKLDDEKYIPTFNQRESIAGAPPRHIVMICNNCGSELNLY